MEDIASHCYTRILGQPKRPLFVAVTGDSGSGKSYLTELLVQRLAASRTPFALINHDDFLISRADREPMKSIIYEDGQFAGKSHWEVMENMFRGDEYRRVIADLKSGKPSSYYPYSRATGDVSDELCTVQPMEIIIFDSSTMLDEMDFVILVDVTQDNIIKRKLIRDSDIRTPTQIRQMHQKVQGDYWMTRGKPQHADIIIDNNDFANVHLLKG